MDKKKGGKNGKILTFFQEKEVRLNLKKKINRDDTCYLFWHHSSPIICCCCFLPAVLRFFFLFSSKRLQKRGSFARVTCSFLDLEENPRLFAFARLSPWAFNPWISDHPDRHFCSSGEKLSAIGGGWEVWFDKQPGHCSVFDFFLLP